MHSIVSHLLPTLESLGIWAYWIIGCASLLEGWWLTGVIVPGTLIVDAGGSLVRLGQLDFFDLAWFVAIGAVLGGEASWHSARWLGSRLTGLSRNRTFQRAQELVRRRGALALVIGHFLGPVTGFAAMAAALSGMARRTFVIWNILGAMIYALVHVAMGYAAGDILARITPYLPRLVLPLGLLALVTAVTWIITRQIRRGGPALLGFMTDLRQRLSAWPPTRHLAARFPRLARVLARRLDPGHGGGLLATALAVLLIYLTGLFIDGALDLALFPETAALDHRVSNLAQAYWSPVGLALAGALTQLGHVPVSTTVTLAAIAGLWLWGRRAAALGFAVSVLGDALTVTLLKLAFGRARPEIGYFLETSNSFPSGHAAISVALYASLFLVLWRERLIGPTFAIVAGVGTALTLGLTRVYLVEHYLSDVLNGWLVGAIWMVIGFGLAEALRGPLPSRRPLPLLALPVVLAGLAGAIWLGASHQPPLRDQPARADTSYADLAGAITDGRLPLQVVTLDGADLPPVSVVSEGAPAAALAAILQRHGWTEVPRPGLQSVVAALRQDIGGRPRAGATAAFAFHAARPADLTLRSADGHSLLRIWQAGRTPTGAPVLALALAPDGPLETWTPEAAQNALLLALGGRDQLLPRPDARGTTDLFGTRWQVSGPLHLLRLPAT
ncbi:bifunctional DedA family/phosphatase PAP2 family protein [Pseudooceanicola sp. CBS1P-1]|uniref:Phosphatase PAP2 family protein n=1 Tax=Pseudooceanicola albus TaxID=2692189 RepID=A0A6L7G6T9_9RHOB|nr:MULTISPECIES: bifunctional DedA family/phosphatase PAP2 family protein [Pseudooceanicola]MBT9385752.1 bifunctional DedA family/phosphatase PAP2 family protein [Pseudooceanicola endophyticus]MXN19984.1 phosphatase PAP2 family protein [Pseudooceanicola albus]